MFLLLKRILFGNQQIAELCLKNSICFSEGRVKGEELIAISWS